VGNDADEFRRRLVSVCAREMAHRMGEAYKTAVLACLDGDEVWRAATGREDGEKGEEIGGAVDAGELDITELFYLHVYSVLQGCCKVVLGFSSTSI
jgi:hypothetical protein